MFKKALAHQSNATPLRSSARRQLVASVLAQYPALHDAVASEGAEGLSEKDLGRLLVPESVRSSTMETSGGVEGTLYSSPEGDPLWMSFGRNSKELVPTLCLLAKLPNSVQPLPMLELPYPLPPPLLTGAALFLPAVRHLSKPWRLPNVPEGSIVALVAPVGGGKEVAYVGVGRVAARDGLAGALERRNRHLAEGVDRDEGKFCDIMCIIDDHLWALGSKPALPTFPLPTPREPLAPPPASEARSIDEAANGVAALTVDNDEPKDSDEPLTPAEVSTLLNAALHQTLTTLPAGLLPLPASQLYSAYILPNRPAYIPAPKRDEAVIARSEWKKLAKWMKELSKDGLVKTKETKGEVVITSFDATHAALEGHRPFKTIAEDEAKIAKKAAREAATAEPSSSAPMMIEELWRPNGAAVAFWEACGIEKGSLNKPGAMKGLVDAYLESNELVDQEEHRVVELDKLLAQAVGGKAGQMLVRDEVMRRLRAGVAWSVSVGGAVKKGTLNPITMSVKTRQGRKQVTLVSGLEGFGIDVDEFADELRRLCAGSASVAPLTGASPKLNLKEVLVQGSQCKLVTEALVGHGVPKRWIKEEGKKK